MKTFSIQYFDGKSSFAHKATLSLKEDSWLICYEREVPLPAEEKTEEEEARTLDFPEWEFQPLTEPEIEPKTATEYFEVVWELAQIHKRETISKTNTFYYGDYPYASIECNDAEFPNVIHTLYPTSGIINKRYFTLFKMGRRGVFMIGTSLISLLVLTYFFILPPVAENAITIIPYSYEQQLGDNVFATLSSEYREDKELTPIVNQFVQNIDFNTQHNIRVTVVKDATVNAFALPGGRIVIFTGLLKKMQNYEELAALLGHEIAHVQQRHSLKSMARAFAGYLFMSAIFSDINGLTATITENAQFLQTMQYSRSAEAEADEKAAEVMIKNKINLKGLVDLFTRLEDNHEHETLEKALSFISSHPQTKDRKDFAKQKLAEQKQFDTNPILEDLWGKLKD